jgi:hypothetical protein
MSTSTEEEINQEGDRIERLIQDKGLRIEALTFLPELDLLLFVLNDRSVIKRRISEFPSLQKASDAEREDHRITPFGVHWEKLDEDIGLKGLLEEELLRRFGGE